jgi:DNA gyrase subunit A
MRIVIELKREAQPEQVRNSLYKHTAMQSAFFVNMLALVDGQPRVISLKEALQQYIAFRRIVITRRSKYDLKVARARAHILEGLKIALDNIEKIIATIRKSETAEAARQNLMTGFGLSREQAEAILDMPLRRLANLERTKIHDEYVEVLKTISYLEDLLASTARMLLLIKEETSEIKTKFADPRRTEISEEGVSEISVEDLIAHQKVVVTLTERGFIKRVPALAYKPQHRGGKGIIGMTTREEDAVRLMAVADTHDNLLLFTNRGRAFNIKCYEVPADTSRVAKGMAVINLFSIPQDERVADMVVVEQFKPDTYVLLATRGGEIKKTSLDSFAVLRSSGLIAMDVEEGDELVAGLLATDKDDVMLITSKAQSIRFAVSSLRASSRTSGGVRGIRLASPDDHVVGMGVARPDSYLLVVTTNGFGKLTPVSTYPRQRRGGSGVRTFKIVEKTGDLVDAWLVVPSQEVMFISARGIVTRTPVQGITIQGRSTQGVTLMKPAEDDWIVAVTCIDVAL